MIQSARFLHLNRWDKQCGGWGKFTEFLRSCGYECVLHVPAKINFRLHSAEPSGLPWRTFGHWQVHRYQWCYLQLFVQVWEVFSTAGVHNSICCSSGQNSTIPVPWAPSAPVVWMEWVGLKNIFKTIQFQLPSPSGKSPLAKAEGRLFLHWNCCCVEEWIGGSWRVLLLWCVLADFINPEHNKVL